MRLKKICSFLLVLVLTASMFWVFPRSAAAEEVEDDRFVKIKLHSGEYGYFGDPETTELELEFFRSDYFIYDAKPDRNTDTVVFIGWATYPDATVPDVESRVTPVANCGSDLYAVWSDTVDVVYSCNDGYIEVAGEKYQEVMMTYKVGAHFRVLEPKHPDYRIDFEGWYTDQFGGGEKFTTENVIDSDRISVNANWKINEDKAGTLELDKEYHFDGSGGGDIYTFTPEVSGLYKIYSYNIEDHWEMSPYFRLVTSNLKQIKDGDVVDTDGNCALSYTMEAGTTYYFQVRDAAAHHAVFDFQISEDEPVEITFHINRGDKNDAWFDDDRSCIEKKMLVPVGTELRVYNAGVSVEDSRLLKFLGWSYDENAYFPSSFLIAREDMDVYAVFEEKTVVICDANGGYFSLAGGATSYAWPYTEDQLFTPDFGPRIDDPRYDFAGWATTPDATEPDIDTGHVLAKDVPQTVYAIYTDKIEVIYDANGGYFMDDPSVTLHIYVTGDGSVFAGSSLKNLDEHSIPAGWTDQNGVFIPYTPDYYYDYHYDGDTYLTAVWGRRVFVDANGGYFSEYEFTAIILDYYMDEPFECPDDSDLWNPDDNKEFVGWATTPNATEPDVIEGRTPVNDLETVYAIWRDKAPDVRPNPKTGVSSAALPLLLLGAFAVFFLKRRRFS